MALAVAGGSAGVYATTTDDAGAAGTSTVVVSTTAGLEQAFAAAKAGTTIQLRGGTYHPRHSLRSQADGTARERITVTSYRSERSVVDGSELPGGQWLVAIGGDHWTLSGLTFRNGPAHGIVVTSSTGGVFKDLTVRGNGDSGFTLRGEDTRDNLIENLDSSGNFDPATHGQNADGLAVKFGSGEGNRVIGARLFHNADDGVDLWKWASPVRIEHSWAYGNGENRWDAPAFEGNGNGFKLGGDGTSAAHVLAHNAAWDNKQHGFTENSNPGALRLHRNTAYRNGAAGFFLQESAARVSRNLAVDNRGGAARSGPRTVSAANSWDRQPDPDRSALRSTDAGKAYGPRGAGGSLPRTSFLVSREPEFGADMR